MTLTQQIITVAIVALMTMATRFTPFLVFSENRPTPKFLSYLATALPPAVFGMLVVFCLKGATSLAYPYALPELISVAAVVLLHLGFRKILVSIVGGTALYMILVNLIFV